MNGSIVRIPFHDAREHSGFKMLIDEFDKERLVTKLGQKWKCVRDEVMDGVSEGQFLSAVLDGSAVYGSFAQCIF
tara:strand:+ start:253 stop:477 length:225 start_codon:yes stop_codon:yes gene_type:complete